MIRIFLLIFFVISSNKVIATIQGETLICDKDSRGYNFITKDKVEVLSVNFDELKINSINHSYQLNENSIFINKPIKESSKYQKSKPIGWIFRRTLDYVSLDYVNGDWDRKFLWSCQIVKLDQLEIRLKNKINKFIKASGNKLKEHEYE